MAYAWGSHDALPAILREAPTGEPQAELWLGDHSGAPAVVAKASREPQTLIDLIASDPESYGVNGGALPFLLKILGIGQPLSIQVHPNLQQAREGFERENAAGVPLTDPTRSYKDANHKPELLVALEPTRALCGFRPVADVRSDVSALTAAAGTCGAKGSQALFAFAAQIGQAAQLSSEAARNKLLDWCFSEAPGVQLTVDALREVVQSTRVPGMSAVRAEVLANIIEEYPHDPGVIVSLLLNLVELEPGQAIYLGAGQIHAYLSGVGVEVMASSDNVLRAGLTQKHVDAAKLREVLDLATLHDPIFLPTATRAGLTVWSPPIPDFTLMRARVAPQEEFDESSASDVAESVTLETRGSPLVLITTRGTVTVERQSEHSREIANVRQGQSLYISAGEPVTISGRGESFLASAGAFHSTD